MPKFTDEGLALVKSQESWSATRYNDVAGNPTIGWGHRIQAGESFPDTLTDQEGDDLLLADLKTAQNAVCKAIDVAINDNQFSALVCLVFNTGPAPLYKTLGSLLNHGNYNGAAEQFDRWVYAKDPTIGEMVKIPDLIARRAKEKALFLTPEASNDNGGNSTAS